MRKGTCIGVLFATLLMPLALSSQPSSTVVILLHGSLHGNVFDRVTGKAVPNAHITFLSTSMHGKSNHSGEFNIDTVPAGTYEVRVSGKGYFSVRAQVRIEPDKDNEIQFKLIRFKDLQEPRRASMSRLPQTALHS